MLVVTLREFRQKIKRRLTAVSQDFETLIVHRKNGRCVVVMPLEEFNSLQATAHLMSSAANEERLNRAIARHQSGEAFEVKLSNV